MLPESVPAASVEATRAEPYHVPLPVNEIGLFKMAVYKPLCALTMHDATQSV